jgi:hypothetical protein
VSPPDPIPWHVMRPPRTPLYGFPDVVIHADELAVKRHPQFGAAKAGAISAAESLVADLANPDRVQAIQALLDGKQGELVSVHALETEGVNEIPAALAKLLSAWLGLASNRSIVQSNTVGHTGASGYHRLANQAHFFGAVVPDQRYLIVDDFVGQGGTLANLIGFIKSQGGHVVGATALTGKPYSAKLAPEDAQIQGIARQAWTGIRRLVAAKIRVRIRRAYPVGSSLPRKLPGCSHHPRSPCCSRT